MLEFLRFDYWFGVNPPGIRGLLTLPPGPTLEILTIAELMSLVTKFLAINGLFYGSCDFLRGGLYSCMRSLRLSKFLLISSALT